MNEVASTDVIIGVDTHKEVHAAFAINGLGAELGAMTIPANTKGYRDLEAWAMSLGAVRAIGSRVRGPTARACAASFALAAAKCWRSIVPAVSCDTRRARATPSTPRARPVRC